MTKMKSLLFAGFAVLMLISFGACKSAPKPTDAPSADEPQATAPSVEDPELVALREKTERLRAECQVYELGSLQKEDWDRAEKSRADGIAAYSSDAVASKAAFTDAIAAYERVLESGLAALESDLRKALAAERQKTIDMGAAAYYPEQFDQADSSTNAAAAALEAGSFKDAYDHSQRGLMRYRTLQNGFRAIALKKKIQQNQFEQYDPESFEKAGVAYDEAAAAYGTADSAAFEASARSVALYEKVSNEGYRVWSQDLMAKNGEVIALCDSIKAKRSLPNEYASADGIYRKALLQGKANDWEGAYGSLSASLVAFADVYQNASLKRNAAETAIAEAKSRQEESAALARKADEVAPLPEGAEGFTDEPSPAESPADSGAAEASVDEASADEAVENADESVGETGEGTVGETFDDAEEVAEDAVDDSIDEVVEDVEDEDIPDSDGGYGDIEENVEDAE